VRQAVIEISWLCMVAALCTQILQKNRFLSVIRLALGLEMLRVLLALIQAFSSGKLGWG